MPRKSTKVKVNKEGDDDSVLEQKKDQLVVKAKKQGFINQKNIFSEIPETVENTEILDQLYTELADLNIEITTTDPSPEAFTDEWEEEAEEE
ncbi:MAG TPA: RNA polymerase sigma factor region1.1 domain-containing protein, partial [Patescibacteria group bacterium]|nr:RNA polymerase sigma factor region1.1 domain-containing protein [Patescibacteria group bacterium]